MRLRKLNVGCFGGGTGLPSLLGGLKRNPWLQVHAVVTMFDSGGSSGQLRDELGVLPPGDVLKCALALARERRRGASRAPGPPADSSNTTSSCRPYRRQPPAVDDGALQRRLPRCRGRAPRAARVPRAACGRSASNLPPSARSTAMATTTRGEVEVDAGQHGGDRIRRVWLEPPPAIHPAVRRPSAVRRGHHRPRQLLHQSDAPPARTTASRDAFADVRGPVMLVANLLTEGRGMPDFTAADAVDWIGERSAGRWTSCSSTAGTRPTRCSRGTRRNTRRRSTGDAPGALRG